MGDRHSCLSSLFIDKDRQECLSSIDAMLPELPATSYQLRLSGYRPPATESLELEADAEPHVAEDRAEDRARGVPDDVVDVGHA